MEPSAKKIKSTTESQGHGKGFENWFIDTFVKSNMASGHTDKWDVQGVTFKGEYKKHTGFLNGVPISIKTCKYNSSVNFGDAIRQFNNTQDFLLVVAFWKQSGDYKKVVQVVAKKVSKGDWHELFIDNKTEKEKGPNHCKKRTREKLQELDKTIKTTKGYKTAREKAKKKKKEIKSPMTLNPKIDSKNQRRLQCSLPKTKFFEFVGEAQTDNSSCTLWGEPIPKIAGKKRKRKAKKTKRKAKKRKTS